MGDVHPSSASPSFIGLGKLLWISVICLTCVISQSIVAGWDCTKRATVCSALCSIVSMPSRITEISVVEDDCATTVWMVKSDRQNLNGGQVWIDFCGQWYSHDSC